MTRYFLYLNLMAAEKTTSTSPNKWFDRERGDNSREKNQPAVLSSS